MNEKEQIQIGAVYFRKSNPPKKDWERDYQVAHEDGHTIFRHWFPWGAIEVAPGKYDWDDYDRQLDLAAKYNINTIIAEMSDYYPEWLYRQYPHARLETRNGTKRTSAMGVSCVTGGFYSLCLDNPEVMDACERFLTALATRYRDHLGLYGYDVWNECSFYRPDLLCYCPATQARFRQWLKAKYGDLQTVAELWHRYSFADWDDVQLSRQLASYPDEFDRIEFHNDSAFHWMKWKVETLRNADPGHPITAHGNAKSFVDIAPACGDDFRAAEPVDIFGYTYWQANRCSPFLAGDMIRSAARGKTFWRAEAVGDSTWMGRDEVNHPRPEEDRMHQPENIRLDCLISLAIGARGFMNPRWRPLLNGPLFGAYGWYGMDGSRTDRSAMMASIAKWVNDPIRAPLWKARPVKGEVAILISEEAQANCYARHSSTDFYSLCVQGAYEAFLGANIQCDFVKIDHIDDYDLLYLPFPVALKDSSADALREWVNKGGCLVSEGCFGYFNEYGRAFEHQPNRGFAEAFGCVEHAVAFAPDSYETLDIKLESGSLSASLYCQSYSPTTGTPVGWYETGEVAIVHNRQGNGACLLVGSMPGYAYKISPSEASRRWFASILETASKKPLVKVNQPGVVARVWRNADEHFLWIVNTHDKNQSVTLTVDTSQVPYTTAVPFRGGEDLFVANDGIVLEVSQRDAVILHLK